MEKYINETELTIKEKKGLEKLAQFISSAVKSYKQSMDHYGEAMIKVKTR